MPRIAVSVDGDEARARAPRTILLVGEVEEDDEFFSRFVRRLVLAPAPVLALAPVPAPMPVPAALISLLRPRDRDLRS